MRNPPYLWAVSLYWSIVAIGMCLVMFCLLGQADAHGHCDRGHGWRGGYRGGYYGGYDPWHRGPYDRYPYDRDPWHQYPRGWYLEYTR